MSPATNQCKIKRMVSAFASFFVLCSRTRITSQRKLLSILATTAKTSATFTLCTLMPRPASFLKMGAGGGGRRGGGSGCGATAEAVHLKETLCVCLSKFPVGDGPDVRHLAGRTLTEGL